MKTFSTTGNNQTANMSYPAFLTESVTIPTAAATASQSLPNIPSSYGAVASSNGIYGTFSTSLSRVHNGQLRQQYLSESRISSSKSNNLNQTDFPSHHHCIDLNQANQQQNGDYGTNSYQPTIDSKSTVNSISSQISLVMASSKTEKDGNSSCSNEESVYRKLSFRRLSRSQKSSLILVCASSFFCSVTFSCIAPFFSMEALAKDATETEVGGIFGVYELAVMLSSPIWARLVPVMGARMMFVTGAFTVGVSSVLYGALEWSPSGTTFVALCFLIRSFEGFGAACYLTAEVPILANQFPEHISVVIGLQAMSISTGFMLGPLVGSVLYTLGGFCMPFFVLGAAGLVTSVVGYFVLPEIRYDENDADSNSSTEDATTTRRAGFRQALKIPVVVVVCICAAGTCSGFAFFDAMLSPFLTNNFQLSAILIGIWFLITGICEAGTSPVVGYALDKRPWHLQLMLLGALTAAVGFALAGPSPLLGAFLSSTIPISVASQAVIGLSVSLLLVPPATSILNACEKAGFPPSASMHGTVGGLITFSESCGNFLGPTLGGYLTEALSFEWTSTIVAGMFLCLAVLLSATICTDKLYGWRGRMTTAKRKTVEIEN